MRHIWYEIEAKNFNIIINFNTVCGIKFAKDTMWIAFCSGEEEMFVFESETKCKEAYNKIVKQIRYIEDKENGKI